MTTLTEEELLDQLPSLAQVRPVAVRIDVWLAEDELEDQLPALAGFRA